MTGVLHISTGNDRRSPLAEMIMRSRWGSRTPELPVWSAGLEADPGAPMDPLAVAALERVGHQPVPFASRQLTPAMIGEADLVITASRAHRDDIGTVLPTSAAKVFTARELALLLRGVAVDDVSGRTPSQRVAALADLAAGRRADTPPWRDVDIDVPAIHGHGLWRYVDATRRLDDALAVVVSLLLTPDILPARVITLPDHPVAHAVRR